MSRKVDCLADIGAQAEASMKGPWKSNDEFSRVLKEFEALDVVVLQQTRTEHGCNMMQKVRYIAHLHGEIALEDFLQSIRVLLGSWDTIPLFRGTLVVVVDAVEVVIFVMIAESLSKRDRRW